MVGACAMHTGVPMSLPTLNKRCTPSPGLNKQHVSRASTVMRDCMAEGLPTNAALQKGCQPIPFHPPNAYLAVFFLCRAPHLTV